MVIVTGMAIASEITTAAITIKIAEIAVSIIQEHLLIQFALYHLLRRRISAEDWRLLQAYRQKRHTATAQ